MNVRAKKSMSKQAMFDLCRSDCWVLETVAKELGAKIIGRFEGAVKTISGNMN